MPGGIVEVPSGLVLWRPPLALQAWRPPVVVEAPPSTAHPLVLWSPPP